MSVSSCWGLAEAAASEVPTKVLNFANEEFSQVKRETFFSFFKEIVVVHYWALITMKTMTEFDLRILSGRKQKMCLLKT